MAIVLATYNGETYLQEQLDSLMRSTFSDFEIFIRDDGSSDKTCNIIQEFVDRNPGKVHWIKDGETGGNACGNFMRLFKYVFEVGTFSYVMCMDQDDLWHSDKIQKTMEAMKEAEKENEKEIPILVHTDLRVVDQDRNEIAHSFAEYSMLNPNVKKVNRILAYNNVTGCTMMLNKKLLEMCVCGSTDIFMHDWWCALIAAAFGEIKYLKEQTIDYRQHVHNTIGASNNKNIRTVLKKASQFMKKINRKETLFDKTIRQAEVFNSAFGKRMSPELKKIIEAYCRLGYMGRIARLHSICKYGFWSQGTYRCFGQIVYLILHKKEYGT